MSTSISFREWASPSELRLYLGESEARTLVLCDAEAPRRHYSLRVESARGPVEIGLWSSDFGVPPAAVKLGERLLLGYDCALAWIDLESGTLAHTHDLMSPFFEFLPIGDETELVVVYELGACRVSSSGSVRWDFDAGDIVTDFALDGRGQLALTQFETGSTITVSIATGERC